MHDLTPYPLYFCPPDIAKPACCPHMGSVKVLNGFGPEGTGGICWGGPWVDSLSTWLKSPAGWWVGMNGQAPQHLTRTDTNPRVVRWRNIPGCEEGHWWRVPVLLTQAGENQEQGLVSALDRVWNGNEWTAPTELAGMQEKLLSLMMGIPLDEDIERRNAEVRRIAIGLLQVGHWVDADFMAATRWLSEKLMVETVLAACDLEPKEAHAAV